MASFRLHAWWPLAAIALAGCQRSEQIASYSVPKPHVLAAQNGGAAAGKDRPQAASDRMLAAILVHGASGWFFKLTGPAQAVADVGPAFRDFVRSVKFADDPAAPPEWQLPDGWKQRGAEGIRFATLQLGGEPPLEITVTTLPADSVELASYRLDNVNRWRGQLGLSSIGPADLEKTAEKLETPGGEALVVDLLGTAKPSGMPPFAGGGFGTPPLQSRPTERPPAPPAKPENLPAGWQVAANDAFSRGAYEVVDGERRLRITVSQLSAAAGDLTANVNRWRAQVGLAEAASAEIEKSSQPIDVGGNRGHYVELIGEKSEAILGVIVSGGGQVWFFKAKGDAELARREAESFRAFVGSQKLN